MRDWDRHFKPTLLSYVATLEDPFGTNCILDAEVCEIWKVIWPGLAGVVENPEKLAAIVGVVRVYTLSLLPSCQLMSGSLRRQHYAIAGEVL